MLQFCLRPSIQRPRGLAKFALLHLAIAVGVLPRLLEASDGYSEAAIGPSPEALRLLDYPFVLFVFLGGATAIAPTGRHIMMIMNTSHLISDYMKSQR